MRWYVLSVLSFSALIVCCSSFDEASLTMDLFPKRNSDAMSTHFHRTRICSQSALVFWWRYMLKPNKHLNYHLGIISIEVERPPFHLKKTQKSIKRLHIEQNKCFVKIRLLGKIGIIWNEWKFRWMIFCMFECEFAVVNESKIKLNLIWRSKFNCVS